MAEPFSGFVVPPVLQSVTLVVGTVIVVALLYAIRPPVSQRTVLSFVPWVVIGSVLHVFYQLGESFSPVYPPALAPYFSAPAVYLTTFLMLGTVWVVAATIVPSARRERQIAQYVGTIGIGIMLALVGLVVWQGLTADPLTFQPIIPILGLIVTLALTFVVYVALGAWRTYIIADARYLGALVLFAHLFDAITTTIGVDLLGASERSVVPRRIMEFAADLPTADTLGTGWLFILVKLLLAVVIVAVFADYIRESPTEGNLLFAFVAVVGLGPALNNFFLFTLGVGTQVPDFIAV